MNNFNSEKFKIVALGGNEFITPFALSGIDTRQAKEAGNDVIKEEEFKNTLYIIDENIVSDVGIIEDFEEKGANITLLKGWSRSDMAGRKIKKASVKAMGVNLFKDNNNDNTSEI